MNTAPLTPLPELTEDLAPGEAVVWQQRPSALRFAKREAGTFAGGLYFCGFSVFWTIAAAGGFSGVNHGRSGPWPMVLFGVGFVCVGVWLLSSPLRAAVRAKRTVYAITDRRAIILEAGMPRRVTTYAPDALGRLIRTQRADGDGDVVIERFTTAGRKGHIQTHDIGFFGIERAADVERQLQNLHG